MAKMDARTVAWFIRDGSGVAGFTNAYDGVSAVDQDGDGMVRASLPVNDHRFALALELGGRAMNLLYPYADDGLCIHGLVKRERACGSDLSATCGCGMEPVSANPVRRAV